MRVALFITCLVDTFRPRAGIAAARLLEHLGYEVVFPADQTCCGQPMFNAGYADDARLVVEHFLDVFESFDCMVTPSASCAAMVRKHMSDVVGADDIDRASRVAANTYELVEFLVRVAGVDIGSLLRKAPQSITAHRPCHLRELGLWDEYESWLNEALGESLVSLAHAEQCCGFGGAFAVKHETLSSAMVADKVNAIRDAGAEQVVCNEAGCAINIEGACRRENVPVAFTTLAELIAESLGLLDGISRQ